MRVTDRHTFFFSGSEPFSNWHPSPFTLKGIRFPTAEHAMMYAKAMHFGDEKAAAAILQADTPREAKALGRQVRPFDADEWDRVARNYVLKILEAKFTQNPHLEQALLATGTTTIVEASPYDRVWGAGLGQDDARIDDPELWPGKNWLGQCLTRLRDQLRTGSGDPAS